MRTRLLVHSHHTHMFTHTRGENFSAKKPSHFICISVCVSVSVYACDTLCFVWAIFWMTLPKSERWNAIRNINAIEIQKKKMWHCTSDTKLNCAKNPFSSRPIE